MIFAFGIGHRTSQQEMENLPHSQQMINPLLIHAASIQYQYLLHQVVSCHHQAVAYPVSSYTGFQPSTSDSHSSCSPEMKRYFLITYNQIEDISKDCDKPKGFRLVLIQCVSIDNRCKTFKCHQYIIYWYWN